MSHSVLTVTNLGGLVIESQTPIMPVMWHMKNWNWKLECYQREEGKAKFLKFVKIPAGSNCCQLQCTNAILFPTFLLNAIIFVNVQKETSRKPTNPTYYSRSSLQLLVITSSIITITIIIIITIIVIITIISIIIITIVAIEIFWDADKRLILTLLVCQVGGMTCAIFDKSPQFSTVFRHFVLLEYQYQYQ